MCEPVSAGIAAGAIVAGTAYSMYSAWRQGKIAKKAGERNAKIAMMAAADAEQRGALEASRVLSAASRNMAKAKAAMLAQGQQIEGSGLQDLLAGMAINAAADSETVRNNAARDAWGYQNQAAAAKIEGEMAKFRADQDAVGSALSGVGQVASIYAKRKSSGSTDSGVGTTGGN